MIEVSQVAKSFGPRVALSGIDLSIDRGEFVTLMGANGAGKTTLLRIVATLTRPSSGTVRVAGMDPRRQGDRVRRCIGFLSHDTLLYDDLTAEQNLRFYARLYDMDPETRRIETLLEGAGLEGRRHDKVQGYSRGMKQRLAVARAVLHEPKILLLDEPYAGLDAQAVEALADLLIKTAGEGSAILLATHQVSHGLARGRRVVVLDHGRVVYDGAGEAVPAGAVAGSYRGLAT